MNTLKDNPRLFWLLLFLTLATAALLRVKYLAAGLEYDEIWSLENFSGMPVRELFVQLALPNNQPLNSLFIKLASALDLPLWGIRLHSLLAGILTLPLAGFICYCLSGGKKAAALWTMVILALSAPDATYAALARGYALQVFFLTLFAAGIAACGRWRPKEKLLTYLPETAVFLGGVCAILTIPTSVMYLGAIVTAAWIIHPVKPGKLLSAVMICGAGFALAYYLYNYQQLNQARIWGTKITDCKTYFSFLGNTAGSLITPAAALMALFAIYCSPARRISMLLILTLPLAAAIVTNAGPPRTYLPFCTAVAILAGCGICDLAALLKEKMKVCGAVLLVIVLAAEYFWYLPAWRTPDWCDVYRAAAREPVHVLVVHRATSGYPLSWNNRPDIHTDFAKRLLDFSPQRELVMFDGAGRINGNDDKTNEAVLPVNTRGQKDRIGGLRCRRYKLVELSKPPRPGEVILVSIRPMASPLFRIYVNALAQSRMTWLQLNPWLGSMNKGISYALLAGKVTKDASVNWEQLLESKGAVSVYRILQ